MLGDVGVLFSFHIILVHVSLSVHAAVECLLGSLVGGCSSLLLHVPDDVHVLKGLGWRELLRRGGLLGRHVVGLAATSQGRVGFED